MVQDKGRRDWQGRDGRKGMGCIYPDMIRGRRFDMMFGICPSEAAISRAQWHGFLLADSL